MRPVTALLLATLCSVLLAAGGKNQWNNPIFSEGCVANLPVGIDLATCEAVPGDGLIEYFCKGEVITVTCPDDGPQAPGQDK